MTTTNKALNQPPSNYLNWDIPLNSNFGWIDSALGGVSTITLPVTNGNNVTLTLDQYRNLILKFGGSTTSNRYILPYSATPIGGQWIIVNNASADITFAAYGQAGGAVVLAGTVSTIASDGTSMYVTADATATATAIVNAALAARKIAVGAGMTITPANGSLSNTTNTLAPVQASAAEYRSAVADKLLTPENAWASINAEVSLTDAATVAWNMSSGFDFILKPTANRAIGLPTNIKVGQKGRLVIQQDATGGRALTWNGVFKFAANTPPVLSTAANAIDVLYYDVRKSNYIIITLAGRNFTP